MLLSFLLQDRDRALLNIIPYISLGVDVWRR